MNTTLAEGLQLEAEHLPLGITCFPVSTLGCITGLAHLKSGKSTRSFKMSTPTCMGVAECSQDISMPPSRELRKEMSMVGPDETKLDFDGAW